MLSQLKINDFIDLLASKQPTPGGGSASALVGVVRAALIAMAANLTTGKKKYMHEQEFIKQLLKEIEETKKRLMALIDEDTEAFDNVSAVFKMPKNTETEKQIRGEALEEALKSATKVPFEIMKESLKAINLVKKSLGHTNPSTVSDTGVAAACLKAALSGAWLSVKVNLNSIKDIAFVENYGRLSTALLEEGIKTEQEIHDYVLRNLKI